MRFSFEGGGCFPTGRHYPGIAHLLRLEVAGLCDEFDATTAMTDLPVVGIDTETTGREPGVDRIVEVACVIWRGGQIVDSHGWLINPGRPIPEEAKAVHGISDDDVREKPTFPQLAGEIAKTMHGCVPLAYNAEFDRRFLRAEFIESGITLDEAPPAIRSSVEWLDPLVWARHLQREEKSKALGEVAARLGIEIGRAHRATDDAAAALKVYGEFLKDPRVPDTYGAFIQEQKRLGKELEEERRMWRRG